MELGMEKLVLKDHTLRCYFIGNPDSPYFESAVFQRILQFIQTRTNKARLKQAGKNFLLIVTDITSMDRMQQILGAMHQFTQEGVPAA